MSERVGFEEPRDVGLVGGQVEQAWSSIGGFFQQIRLWLPRGSRVFRADADTIRVKTPRVTVDITTRFPGFTPYVSGDFVKVFLKVENVDGILPFKVRYMVEMRFSRAWLFFPGDWQHYSWVDAFVRSLDHEAAFSSFLETIGWDAALTVVSSVGRTDPAH